MAQYDSYDAFLPYCPSESKPNLMLEMLRINDEIKRIQCMTLSELQTQIDDYYDTKKSKLNEGKIENFGTRDDVFRRENEASFSNASTGSEERPNDGFFHNAGCYG